MCSRASEGPEKRLAIMAKDIVHLYNEFTNRFPISAEADIDGFRELYDASQLEYIHYSGNTSLEHPFHEHIVCDVLRLAAAYFDLPSEVVRPHIRPFAFLLSFFLYSTQPGIKGSARPTQVPVRLSVMQKLVAATDRPEEAMQDTVPANLCSPSEKRSCRPALSSTEIKVLLAMHQNNAWGIQPHVDAGVYVAALVQAHDEQGASLLHSSVLADGDTPVANSIRGAVRNSSLSDGSFAAQLRDYEELKRQLGVS